MITTKYITKYNKLYTVYPFLNSINDNGDQLRLEVRQSNAFGDGFGKATISWPSCGAQEADYVAKFVEGLQFAQAIATELDAGREPQDNRIVGI